MAASNSVQQRRAGQHCSPRTMGNSYITRHWFVPYWPSLREGAAHLRGDIKDGARQNECAIAGFARALPGTTSQVAPLATDRKYMRITTTGNIEYDLDMPNSRIRRVGAEWREYHSLDPSTPELDVSLFIDWTGHANGIHTGMITHIEGGK